MPQAPDCSACGHPESSHTQGWGCHVYSCDCGDYRMAPTDADTEAEGDTELEVREALQKSIELHEEAARTLPDEHGDEHRAVLPGLRRLRESDPGGGEDAQTVARWVVGWWPCLEDDISWGSSQRDEHPAYQAARRIVDAVAVDSRRRTSPA